MSFKSCMLFVTAGTCYVYQLNYKQLFESKLPLHNALPYVNVLPSMVINMRIFRPSTILKCG